MRDFLCKGYDKLYGFLGYANMQLILGYESGGKGCTRISFYIRVLHLLFPWPLSHPLHLRRLKSQHKCNNPIVERVCNRQRLSSPAYANLVFLHQPVGKYYLFR